MLLYQFRLPRDRMTAHLYLEITNAPCFRDPFSPEVFGQCRVETTGVRPNSHIDNLPSIPENVDPLSLRNSLQHQFRKGLFFVLDRHIKTP